MVSKSLKGRKERLTLIWASICGSPIHQLLNISENPQIEARARIELARQSETLSRPKLRLARTQHKKCWAFKERRG